MNWFNSTNAKKIGTLYLIFLYALIGSQSEKYFPFQLVTPSLWPVLFGFALFNAGSSLSLDSRRTLFFCSKNNFNEKKVLATKEPKKSDTKLPFSNDPSGLKNTKLEGLNSKPIYQAEKPKNKTCSGDIKLGIIARFIKKITTYYRRILTGLKKGISTPTLPPQTLQLLAHPLIRILRILGPLCMYICVTNSLVYFNNYFKYLIFSLLMFNIIFSFYITIVRVKNIRKLLKAGAFDIRKSSLDRMSSLIARMIACTKGVCESGGTVAGAIAGLYTIDNLMRDLGYDPIFLPLAKWALTNSSETDADPSVEADKNNKILTKHLKGVYNRHLSAKEEEAFFQMFYDSQIISREDWLELQKEFKTRYNAIEGDKELILKQIKDNLEKGYGVSEVTKDSGLTYTYPTSSKILEALKESGNLSEDLFPRAPIDLPTSSKVLEALKESGNLTETTFTANSAENLPTDRNIEKLIDKNKSSFLDGSKNKTSINEFKLITDSENDSISQSNNNNNKKK